jgi:N-methylhydantoinase A
MAGEEQPGSDRPDRVVQLGVDTGGTFTDLVVLDDGELRIAKVSSTPPAFERGIVAAVRAAGIDLRQVAHFAHGTTATTNAIITKQGARTGLVTTAGFRDVLELRRHNREDLYDIAWDPPLPLVPRRDRLEVRERVAYDGAEIEPLDPGDAARVVALARARGWEAAAVVFLHSYAAPEHERQMRDLLERELPEVYIVASAEILPEEQEFERTATTVANAYLGPVFRGYITRLRDALELEGYRGTVFVMHSGGGLQPSDSMERLPVRTVTSGPAAGVIAAAEIGASAGRRNLLTIDVGGTSADIATVRDGTVGLARQSMPEFGLPIRFPAIDLVTMGAGGGSIAWIDSAGYPKVGPQSAGAVPGPAAYARGGTEATVTDANLVLGRLSATRGLAEDVPLDAELARAAVAAFGSRLGLGVEEAAAGIVRIANANMTRWLRVMTVERGLDPREFALFAFGGAGPMHAVDLARGLEMPEVLVPRHPGVTSALGLLFADVTHDFSSTLVRSDSMLDDPESGRLYSEMAAQAHAALDDDGFSASERTVERLVDVRYIGQVKALTLPVDDASPLAAQWEEIARGFVAEYERRFQYVTNELQLEISALRVRGRGHLPRPQLPRLAAGSGAPPRTGTRPVWFDGEITESAVYLRDELLAGHRFTGPAVVEQLDTTTVVPPGVECIVTPQGNLILDCRATEPAHAGADHVR